MSSLTFGSLIFHGRADEIVTLARLAESLGYDSVSMGEHIMMGAAAPPTPWALTGLAIAAGATERVKLVSSVLLLPLHHPVVLAKETAVLDAASNGRLVVGIGVGGEFPQEFDAVGVPLKQRGSRADETLDIVRRLWREDNVRYQGKYFQLNGVTIRPRPQQQPGPPIWVAGRKEAAMRRAVRFGSGWFPYLYSAARYRESVASVKELARQQGVSVDGFTWGLHIMCVAASSADEAKQVVHQYLSGRYTSPERTDEFVRTTCAAGTPDAIIAQVQEFVKAGVQHVNFSWTGEGAVARRSMELVGREVLPALRSMRIPEA